MGLKHFYFMTSLVWTTPSST